MQVFTPSTALPTLLIFAALLLVYAEAQVVWSNYPDIQSGKAFITQLRSLSTRAAV